MESFARLALSLIESPPLLWYFKHEKKSYLGTFSVYMSWKGDVPLFTYITLKKQPHPFLAYKGDGEKEECLFANNFDDTRYTYAPIINLKGTPSIFKDSLGGKSPTPPKPLAVELDTAFSLMRLLFLLASKEYTSLPIWHFRKGQRQILGVCVPFEHYYEANALPVYFYLQLKKPPEGPFFRYITSKTEGETIEYVKTTSDAKFFYSKIIDVEEMPLFPK